MDNNSTLRFEAVVCVVDDDGTCHGAIANFELSSVCLDCGKHFIVQEHAKIPDDSVIAAYNDQFGIICGNCVLKYQEEKYGKYSG